MPLLAAHSQIQRYVVAYSGGVDSHVLLHLLATHRDALDRRNLAAVYVNHGLRSAADKWETHCRRVCRELGMEFRSLRVDARPQPGESPEAAARRARYRALEEILERDQALLTAHHRDDQAETLLLQLLRGAGPQGLAAMPASAPLGRSLLLRPLLETQRTEILAYAQQEGLVWVEDDSNTDLEVDRNYLRHEILPLLKQRWPAAVRTLGRSARLCAETAALADAQAAQDLPEVSSGRPDSLNIPALRALDLMRQRNLLRYWLRGLNLPVPSAVQLQHIISDAVEVPQDRLPCIRWRGGEVRRYRDSLIAGPPMSPHDSGRIIPWPGAADGRTPLWIPGIGRLILKNGQNEGLQAESLAGQPLSIRFRRGGERFRPRGRRHSQELKKLFQEAAIPPWERDRIPLLYIDEELAAVAGLWIGADFAAYSGEDGLVLEWQREPLFGILKARSCSPCAFA